MDVAAAAEVAKAPGSWPVADGIGKFEEREDKGAEKQREE